MDLVKYSPRLRRAIERSVALVLISLPAVAATQAQDAQAQATPAQDTPPAGENGRSDAREAAVAAPPANVLEHFVERVDDLSARFVQREYDAEGGLIETAEGEFLLLRPDRYLWHYEPPFEELFVADGETLWHYEVDIELATRAPLADFAATPAALLSGETAVSDAYEVRELPALEDQPAGVSVVELVPLENELEFESATIAFSEGVPILLEFVDALGELTQIEFSDVVINEGLDPERFAFEPPRGVDIIGDD